MYNWCPLRCVLDVACTNHDYSMLIASICWVSRFRNANTHTEIQNPSVTHNVTAKSHHPGDLSNSGQCCTMFTRMFGLWLL